MNSRVQATMRPSRHKGSQFGKQRKGGEGNGKSHVENVHELFGPIEGHIVAGFTVCGCLTLVVSVAALGMIHTVVFYF